MYARSASFSIMKVIRERWMKAIGGEEIKCDGVF